MDTSKKFALGDTVTWTSQAAGYKRTKTGVIAQVVEPKGLPNRAKFPSLHRLTAIPRDHESYVVRVPGKTERSAGTVYWPRVSGLDRVAPAQIADAVANGAQATAHDLPVPFSERDMRSWGYEFWRCLPDETVMAVGPMSISNGRLFWDVHGGGYEDFYCYDSVELAVASMMAFDPAVDKEPTGWHRHAKSGRRRPDGDATREYINP